MRIDIHQRRVLEDLLSDKFLHIVGKGETGGDNYYRPHPSLVQTEVAVCRVNHIGDADILFQSGDLDPYNKEGSNAQFLLVGQCREFSEDWRQWGLKHQMWVIPFFNDAYRSVNPYGAQHEWSNRLCKELKTMPLTGIMAVAFFQQLAIPRIELYGFDFYKEANGSVPIMRHSHNLKIQRDWLEYQLEMDGRLRSCN